MIAQDDGVLFDWLYGVANNKPTEAGSFLKAVVDAAWRADSENYMILRPALVRFWQKYPTYSFRGGDYGNASATP